MKVKKSTVPAAPAYPTRRQFARYGALLGAAAALGTTAAGCRHTPATHEEFSTGGVILTTIAGIPPFEPQAASYVVQKGDTLYGIAKRRLGDGNRWRDLVAANPGLTPEGLKAGQALVIPTE